MIYSEYLSALATLMATTTADTNFVAIVPQAITYAENRIYRDLNLLANTVRNATGTLTVLTRVFTAPQHFNTIFIVNVLTSASATFITGTTRPLIPVSYNLLEFLYPRNAVPSLPVVFTPLTDQDILVGPTPNANYPIEVIGTVQPAALSASNTSTTLSLYLPDLFLAASMIFMAGYQKNFGAQADDPRMAMSWETQYGKLLASANKDEMRRRFATIDSSPRTATGSA